MIGLLGHLIRHSLEIQGWLRKNEDGIGTNSPSSPLKVAGIVLIDEVDLHLHPSWQRLALSQLQDAFPNLQFIVTTHSPLVLGGIPDGKVTVLRRDEEGKVVVLKDEPSVKGWRVDQLLTGVHFDVSSSYDTTTERLITRYAKLLNEKGSSDPAVREAAKEIHDIKPPEHTGAELEIKAWTLLKELTHAKVEKMSSAEREQLLSSLRESKDEL
jgi:predicted ATP-binding protein involved in virulence